MTFYLGTHRPNWLWDPRFVNIPLCLSRNELVKRKKFQPATTDWVLDSGAFTALAKHGKFTVTAAEYAKQAQRLMRIGRMVWASIQDWMCEPFMTQRTGLTVLEHQRRSVQSWVELTDLAPDVPWLPVLQGWTPQDYVRHLQMYRDAGYEGRAFGLGSVCRRQATSEIEDILFALKPFELDLHGFGVKTQGLTSVGDLLFSADSFAWSFDARKSAPLIGCTHKSCANCALWAIRWRERMLKKIGQARQFRLFEVLA